MPSWLSFILITLGLAIAVFITFSLLRYFVFPKIRPNKWLILGLAIFTFLIPILFPIFGMKLAQWFYIVSAAVFMILVFWFLDLMGWIPKAELPENTTTMKRTQYNAPPVIKAKAKPNRLKNSDMEVIEIKDYQRKKNNKKK